MGKAIRADKKEKAPMSEPYIPMKVKEQLEAAKLAMQGITDKPPAKPLAEPDAVIPQIVAPPVEPVVATPPVEDDLPPLPTISTPTMPDSFEQQYKVLQGKYDSELPAARAEIQRQNSVIADLNNVILAFQSAPRPAPVVEPVTPSRSSEDTFEEINPELFEEYGPEMKDLLGTFNKMVKRVNQPSPGGNNGPMASAEPVSPAPSQSSGMDPTFQAEMNSRVGDWLIQNNDPRFVNWLKTSDPQTGMARQVMLNHHFHAANSPATPIENKTVHSKAVADLFIQYKRDAVTPVTPNPSFVANPGVPEPMAHPLASQVVITPSVGASPNPQGAHVPIITSDQYNAYVDERRKGNISEEQMKQVNLRYMKQIKEGRV